MVPKQDRCEHAVVSGWDVSQCARRGQPVSVELEVDYKEWEPRTVRLCRQHAQQVQKGHGRYFVGLPFPERPTYHLIRRGREMDTVADGEPF